jgi:Cu-Zn family superoxide dismutase
MLFYWLAVCISEDILVQMNLLTDQGISKSIGTVTVKDTQHGALLIPQLTDLTPGLHGFHVHQSPTARRQKDNKPIAVWPPESL